MSRSVRGGASRPTALAVVALAALLATPSACSARETIEPSEAAANVGEEVTVCGQVVDTAYLARSSSRPTFLNFERPFPETPFTVVIWPTVRERFDEPPHQYFLGKTLCVDGRITLYKGRPQIVIDGVDQIRVEASNVSGDANLSYEERTLVMAVLGNLGYDLEYGSGQWTEDADAAVLEFQKARGLDPDPGVGAETLRELGRAVGELAPEQQAECMRLFLFGLAQREESGFGE
jgi:hypothetical protein